MGWVLRLYDGCWWTGEQHGRAASLSDARLFGTPGDCRDAMAAVGWGPYEPGFIQSFDRAERCVPVPPPL